MSLRLRRITLAAGNDAQNFDPIAFRKFTLGPFALMKRASVVLDQNAVCLKSEALRELSDVRHFVCLRALAIDENFHEASSAWSQSFQTGSKPRRRKTAAISAGERASLISNWPAADSSIPS